MDIIEEEGYSIMPIIRFVSSNPNNNIIRLLIAGTCPSCEMMHMRNTCNARFCREVMYPILSDLFPGKVSSVIPVSTHDPDLIQIVNKFGLRVSFPCPSYNISPFFLIRDFITDKHPDVDSWVKEVKLKEGKKPFKGSAHVTREMVVKRYTIEWIVDDFVRVYLKNGQLAMGKDEVMYALQNNLIPDYIEVKTNDVGTTKLEISDVSKFNTAKYISIE